MCICAIRVLSTGCGERESGGAFGIGASRECDVREEIGTSREGTTGDVPRHVQEGTTGREDGRGCGTRDGMAH